MCTCTMHIRVSNTLCYFHKILGTRCIPWVPSRFATAPSSDPAFVLYSIVFERTFFAY